MQQGGYQYGAPDGAPHDGNGHDASYGGYGGYGDGQGMAQMCARRTAPTAQRRA